MAVVEFPQLIELCLTGKQAELALLQTIPGVSRQSAIVIVSEIGLDMSQFISDKHLASWAGVCPGNNENAGKVRSARTTHGNTYLKTALIEAAWSASHTMNPYLSFKYHKLTQRREKGKRPWRLPTTYSQHHTISSGIN